MLQIIEASLVHPNMSISLSLSLSQIAKPREIVVEACSNIDVQIVRRI
jgi:hypothetical protein